MSGQDGISSEMPRDRADLCSRSDVVHHPRESYLHGSDIGTELSCSRDICQSGPPCARRVTEIAQSCIQESAIATWTSCRSASARPPTRRETARSPIMSRVRLAKPTDLIACAHAATETHLCDHESITALAQICLSVEPARSCI